MDLFTIAISLSGIALLSIVCLPFIIRRSGIIYPLVFLLAGLAWGFFRPDTVPFDTSHQFNFSHRLPEAYLALALMSSGLSINKPFSLRGWKIPLRLSSLTLLLSTAIIAIIGFTFLGMDPALAILVGAALSPTDPLLSNDLQIALADEATSDESLFSISGEAAINNGLCLALVSLAVLLSQNSGVRDGTLLQWLAYDLLYRILAAIITGYGLARAIYFLYFRLFPERIQPAIQDGLLAVATTFLVYALAEAFQGYGLLAVFIAAITVRNQELRQQRATLFFSSMQQLERIVWVALLIYTGFQLLRFDFRSLPTAYWMAAIAIVLLIRPVTAFMGLTGVSMQFRRKAFISLVGIKGFGSVYFLTLGMKQGVEESSNSLTWVTLVVLMSLLYHGIICKPLKVLLLDRN